MRSPCPTIRPIRATARTALNYITWNSKLTVFELSIDVSFGLKNITAFVIPAKAPNP